MNKKFDRVTDITGNLNRFNIGWQGSIGFELILKSGKIFMNIGGTYGLIPIQKDVTNGSTTTDNAIVTIAIYTGVRLWPKRPVITCTRSNSRSY